MTPQRMHLNVVAKDGDAEVANELTWDLVETLKESPADDVGRPRAEATGGEKATVLDWASLLVTFTGGLPAIVGYVRSFVHRQPDAASVTIELDGDKLVIERADPEAQERIVQAFLARHPPVDAQ